MKHRIRRVEQITITEYFLIVTLLSLAVVLSGCEKKKQDDEKFDVELNFNKYNAAVFERNNNIYFYEKSDQYFTPIGDLTRLKELTALNKEEEQVAFKYVDDSNIVNIYSIKDRKYSTMKVDLSEGEYISNLQWKSGRLIVQVNINPTTYSNYIYDFSEDKVLNTCEGIVIGIDKDNDRVIYGKSTNGYIGIYSNDDKIFDVAEAGEVLINGNIDNEGSNVAFITYSYDREKGTQNEYLYQGVLKEGSIEEVKREIKPFEISGTMSFYNNRPIIEAPDNVYYMTDKKFTAMTEENTAIGENSNRIKEMLKNTFKSENINVDDSFEQLQIYNITWFTYSR